MENNRKSCIKFANILCLDALLLLIIPLILLFPVLKDIDEIKHVKVINSDDIGNVVLANPLKMKHLQLLYDASKFDKYSYTDGLKFTNGENITVQIVHSNIKNIFGNEKHNIVKIYPHDEFKECEIFTGKYTIKHSNTIKYGKIQSLLINTDGAMDVVEMLLIENDKLRASIVKSKVDFDCLIEYVIYQKSVIIMFNMYNISPHPSGDVMYDVDFLGNVYD